MADAFTRDDFGIGQITGRPGFNGGGKQMVLAYLQGNSENCGICRSLVPRGKIYTEIQSLNFTYNLRKGDTKVWEEFLLNLLKSPVLIEHFHDFIEFAPPKLKLKMKCSDLQPSQ